MKDFFFNQRTKSHIEGVKCKALNLYRSIKFSGIWKGLKQIIFDEKFPSDMRNKIIIRSGTDRSAYSLSYYLDSPGFKRQFSPTFRHNVGLTQPYLQRVPGVSLDLKRPLTFMVQNLR